MLIHRPGPQPLYNNFCSHLEGSGIDGDLEISVFQGKIPDEVMVGETVLALQKLPSEGYDRKP